MKPATPSKLFCVFALIASLFLVCASEGQAQLLLLHYDFQQPLVGGKVQNIATGDANNRDGTLLGNATVFNGAFDNTASTSMGAGAANGGGLTFTSAFGGNSSWTASLWFNASSVNGIGNTARLFSSGDVYLSGLGTPGTGATLQVYAAGTQQINVADPIYSGVSDKWVFVAVTYDGAGNLRLYAGSDTQSAQLIQTVASTTYTGSRALPALTFGSNTNGTGNPFDGYLGDIRIYTAYGGSAAGALSLTALENVRLEGLSVIPEPSTAATLLGSLAFSALFFRRRSREKILSGI